MDKIKDVHTEHCCQRHGCKYGHRSEKTCTVTTLVAPQSFPCEWCMDDEEIRQAYEMNDMFNRGLEWALVHLGVSWS